MTRKAGDGTLGGPTFPFLSSSFAAWGVAKMGSDVGTRIAEASSLFSECLAAFCVPASCGQRAQPLGPLVPLLTRVQSALPWTWLRPPECSCTWGVGAQGISAMFHALTEASATRHRGQRDHASVLGSHVGPLSHGASLVKRTCKDAAKCFKTVTAEYRPPA